MNESYTLVRLFAWFALETVTKQSRLTICHRTVEREPASIYLGTMLGKGIEAGITANAVCRSLIAMNASILASTRRSHSSSTAVCSDISD
ncbi:hypothetical protein [Bifidobacterium sp. ESL0764]|uniref:hypothetical protein n=1 Tax=Bifidobacterium sp. ESL0764 TaxID=2983228 RepID=UPI0023FA1A5C|nr:hypothetical protein [Bifidobacterium sp. ESL0764]WEV65425.1 hypothetical protein OZX71_06590 [Bifidobacterium sp. ESL0764]